MQSDYIAFLDRMIDKYEGGYGWDKADAGGPTKYGITCYDLAEHRHLQMTSMSAWAPLVKAMDRSEAEAIYWTKYGVKLRFNDLPAGTDCCIFDYGVNSGIGRPIRVARALLGVPGPLVMDSGLVSAIAKQDPKSFVDRMCSERMHFLQGLRNWGTFHGGWTARVNDLDRVCDAMATGTALPAPPVVAKHPKATHTDPSLKTKSTGAGAVIVTGGGAAAHYGASPWIVGGIVLAGIAGGAAYAFYQQKRNEVANNTVVLPPGVAYVGAN